MIEDALLKERLYQCKSDKINKYSIIKMCDTPSICLAIGMNPYPMIYTQKHLRNAFYEHSVSLGTLSMIPQALSDPVMIFDSFTRNDSIVFLTSLTNADFYPLVVVVKPNGDVSYGQNTFDANRILSVYGKDSCFDNFIKGAINENRVLFCNKPKIEKIYKDLRIPFPNEFKDFQFNRIIKESENIIDVKAMRKQREANCQIIEEDYDRDER